MKGQLGQRASKASLACAERGTVSTLGNGTLSTGPPESEAEGSSAQGDAASGVRAQSADLGPAVRSPGRRCWTDVGQMLVTIFTSQNRIKRAGRSFSNDF